MMLRKILYSCSIPIFLFFMFVNTAVFAADEPTTGAPLTEEPILADEPTGETPTEEPIVDLTREPTGTTPTEEPIGEPSTGEPTSEFPTDEPIEEPTGEPVINDDPSTTDNFVEPSLELDDPEYTEYQPLDEFGVDEESLNIIDDSTFDNINSEAFGSFDAENIEDLPQEVFDDFDAQDIQNLPPEAVEAIDPVEFALLEPEALSGFTKENVDALNEAVLETMYPEELAAINPEAIKNSARPGYIFTNLDSDFISVKQVQGLLPDGWAVDENTGELTAPEGANLTYKAYDDSFTGLSYEEAVVAPSVDLTSSFGVGGSGGKSAELLLNESLQQTEGLSANVDLDLFSLNQDESGEISIEGSAEFAGVDINFLASTDNIDQAPADTPVGLGQDEGGFITMTAPNHHRFTLTPAPDVTDLVNSIDTEFTEEFGDTGTTTDIIDDGLSSTVDVCASADNQKVKLNSDGDVLMQLPESTVRQARSDKQTKVYIVCIFDAFTEPSPNQYCPNKQCNWAAMPDNLKQGIHFPNKVRSSRADRETGYTVYGDGSSQKFYPTVLYPDKFKELVEKIEGVSKVVYQTDGGFKAVFNGNPVLLYPTFDTTITNLKEDEVVKPSVKLKQDGSFSYAVQDCSRLVTTTVVLQQ